MFEYVPVIGRGFKGGPDFRLNRTNTVDLNGIQLEMTAPKSNIHALEHRMSEIPFRQEGWFDQNCKQTGCHIYVDTSLTELWAYMGPYWKVMNEPLGILTVDCKIVRTLPSDTLQAGNLDPLAKAIARKYKEFYESPVPGRFGRGQNQQAIRDAEANYGGNQLGSGSKWEDKIRESAKMRSQELPKHFMTQTFGSQNWLFYELKEPNYPIHHYCQVLDDRFYLDIQFCYQIDFKQYFHVWKDHAEAAENKIMSSVRLSFPDRIY